jgi:hypothetical protein
MGKPITWVGIGDDKMNRTVAVVRGPQEKDPEVRRIPNEDRALGRFVLRWRDVARCASIALCNLPHSAGELGKA